MNLLKDLGIVIGIRQAWRESEANAPVDRHEEGGYIVVAPDHSYRIERWPRGELCRITPPSIAPDNRYNGMSIVAAFHTHPNPPVDEMGREWEQGPSRADRRWHERHEIGGFVVSQKFVYGIDASGQISLIGPRDEVLG